MPMRLSFNYLESTQLITVAVRDAGIDGPVFWAYANITISVVISTIPPTFPQGPYVLTVPELSPAGTFVGNITAASPNYAAIMQYTISPSLPSFTCPFIIISTLTPTATTPVQVRMQ